MKTTVECLKEFEEARTALFVVERALDDAKGFITSYRLKSQYNSLTINMLETQARWLWAEKYLNKEAQ